MSIIPFFPSGWHILPVAFLLAALTGFSLSGAQGIAAPGTALSLADVVSRMARMDEERSESLKEYTSVRRYTLQNKRFGTFAEIRVRMNYHQPGTKAFEVISEKGSSMIRKSVLQRLMKTELEATRADLRATTRISAQNYQFKLLGADTQQDRLCYVLQAHPKSPTKYLFRGRVWVDAEDFAVIRIEGAPAQNPSFWIQKTAFVHTYERFGPYWLPVANASESDVRVFGKTTVTVDYSDYRTNERAMAPAEARSADAQQAGVANQ